MPQSPFTCNPARFDELFPDDLLQRLPALRSQESSKDPLVHAHFTMGNCTWLILEANALVDEASDDWVSLQAAQRRGAWPPVEVECFALCDLGMGFPELGYLYLSEIFLAAQRPGRPTIRRVKDFHAQPLRGAGQLVDWIMPGKD